MDIARAYRNIVMTTTSPQRDALLGRNIRAEMVRKGISQEAIGQRLGKSQAAISKRLRGEIPITVNEAATIASHLGVDLDTLLQGVSQ